MKISARYFSIIIPVYNRVQEVEELLESLTKQTYTASFEVIIVDDGSTIPVRQSIKEDFSNLNISYFFKQNSGAGLSRNFGMQKAKGDYFIILDSDCLLPPHYLDAVTKSLSKSYSDAFGGSDTAHVSFSILQKAINYSMTSMLTTGGIRGHKNSIGKFQPRSFNMGISKRAFEKTKGFSSMKTGEDIDLTFRLWEQGFTSKFIKDAFVYHKRRNTLLSFFKQVYAFGRARPLLNRKYPHTAKWIYWLPTLFTGHLILAIILGITLKFYLSLYIVLGYFSLLFFDALLKTRSFQIGITSCLTSLFSFLGYGLGFLKQQVVSFIKT